MDPRLAPAAMAACTTLEQLANRTRSAMIYSTKKERRLGASAFDKYKEEHRSKILPQGHEASKRVHGVASKIVEAAEVKFPRARDLLCEWEAIVIDDGKVNASCMSGCKIVVHTGLLKIFRDDAELAAVLSHEVAHAVARHGVKGGIVKFWYKLMSKFIKIPDMITCPCVISLLCDTMYNYLVWLPMSRRMEIEADHIGLSLLAAAGYDPGVASPVLKKLGKELRVPIWFKSTHPSFKKRARLVLRRYKEMKDSSGS